MKNFEMSSLYHLLLRRSNQMSGHEILTGKCEVHTKF